MRFLLVSFFLAVFLDSYAQPTNLTFSDVFPTRLTGSFTASVSNPSGYIVLMSEGVPPSADPQDGTVYQQNSLIANAYAVHIGTATSFNVNINPASTLYFKVYAYTNDGSIDYLTDSTLEGNVTTPPLANQPTVQGHSFRFVNISAATMRLSWVSGNGSGRLIIARQGQPANRIPEGGRSYVASPNFGDGDDLGEGNFVVYKGTANTMDITNLMPGTTYHFRLFEYNGSANYENYFDGAASANPSFHTSASGSDGSPPVITHTSPLVISVSTPVMISAQISDPQTGIAEAKIFYNAAVAASGPTDVVEGVLTNTSGNTFSLTVDQSYSMAPGIFYFLYARNGDGIEFTSPMYQANVSFSGNGVTVPYGIGSKKNDYQIVSFPIGLESKMVSDVFEDDLGVYDKSYWRLFTYKNGETTELNSTSEINPGQGYWLIVRDRETELDTGPGTALGSITDPFKITLQPGWNLIGNPYPFNVLWQDVLEKNGNPQNITNLRVFNNLFSNGSILEKFRGGFIFNSGDQFDLDIPVFKNELINSRTANFDSQLNESSEGWEVLFTLKNGDAVLNIGGLGMSSLAFDGFDSFDDVNLPRFGGYLELEHRKSIKGFHLLKDIVPLAPQHSWEFSVRSNQEDPYVELVWDPEIVDTLDGELFLWDETECRKINMRTTSRYVFSRQVNKGEFRVIFGDDKYVSENTRVDEFILHSIFPNPAATGFNVRFSIPGKTDHVSIEMFDKAGKKIATIVEGTFGEGSHEIPYNIETDNDNLTPGLYLIRLISGQVNKSQRLIIK